MIRRYIRSYLSRHDQNGLHEAKNRSEQKYLANHDYPEITDEELKQIQEAWPYMNLTKKDLTWSRIYKKKRGFSPYFIGSWQTHLLRQALNPYAQLSSFENKALCDVYFPLLPFPRAYVRRLQGVYYDVNMSILSELEAVDVLLEKQSYVIKPAFGTMRGQGVNRIQLKNEREIDVCTVRNSFEEQESDFIAQEVLLQHPDVAALNPSSLNCCRVTTIYIDGHFGYSTIIKFGRRNSNVDNWHSSYLGGVSATGLLLGDAFDYSLNRTEKTDFGQVLKGMQLPCFKEMIGFVEQAHKKYFPNCGVIGWDVFVDNNNQVRIIEANLTCPAFVGEQLASGTFFEPFREEINNRMKKVQK